MVGFNYVTRNFKDDKTKEKFFKFPKSLMYDVKYKGLSSNAKILYSMLFDRTRLSVENDWFDEAGNAYIICELSEIEVFLKCARGTASKALKELVKYNLVQKVRHGQGEVNLLYVAYIETVKEALDIHIKFHKRMVDALKHKRAVEEEERKKRKEEKLKHSQKSNNCTSFGNAGVKNYEQLDTLETLRSSENEFVGVQEIDPKDTNKKDTDVCMCVGNAPHGEEDIQKSFLDRYKEFLVPSRYTKKVLPLLELKINYDLFDKVLVDAINNPKKKNKENYIIGTLNKLILKGIYTLDDYMESVSVYNYEKFQKKKYMKETGVSFTAEEFKRSYNMDKAIVEETITEGLSIDKLIEESMKSKDFYVSLRPALRSYVGNEIQDRKLFMPTWINFFMSK